MTIILGPKLRGIQTDFIVVMEARVFLGAFRQDKKLHPNRPGEMRRCSS
jgi:hypothetical protein